MNVALRFAMVAVLVAGCGQVASTAEPTNTPFHYRRLHLVALDPERQVLVVDQSELIVGAARVDLVPEGDVEPEILPGDLPGQTTISWYSRPCDYRQSVMVARTDDGLSLDVYTGPSKPGGVCGDVLVPNGILVTFTGPPPPITGGLHQGSPPQ